MGLFLLTLPQLKPLGKTAQQDFIFERERRSSNNKPWVLLESHFKGLAIHSRPARDLMSLVSICVCM